MSRKNYLAVAIAVVTGCVLLALSLAGDIGGAAAFGVTTTLLAGVWVLGAFAAGPAPAGRFPPVTGDTGRAVALGTAVGVVLAAVFVAGGALARLLPWADSLITEVLAHMQQGSVVVIVALLNAVAEEMFFRGPVYTLLQRHRPILTSTLAYTAVTAFTGNPMLVLAAVPLGLACAAQRRATGGILAPVCTHLVWSATMMLVLPRLF
ncbi:CPBP family intramembrane glutamic endopeptidase [Nocardia brevicatena]|uniref:CPBP family intramembrane glutamic endopeptidase n=1 Tax=Nocardia brevicatena TaxID=37327 RepID=UPI0003159E81|nr:CPBP family intramembrane glutamic endopeptidase [Nocardia brevicatena]